MSWKWKALPRVISSEADSIYKHKLKVMAAVESELATLQPPEINYWAYWDSWEADFKFSCTLILTQQQWPPQERLIYVQCILCIQDNFRSYTYSLQPHPHFMKEKPDERLSKRQRRAEVWTWASDSGVWCLLYCNSQYCSVLYSMCWLAPESFGIQGKQRAAGISWKKKGLRRPDCFLARVRWQL